MSHVCSYWRESVISVPGVWNWVSSRKISLARLSLERCKAVPLEVSFDICGGNAPDFFDLIKPHVQNIKALAIYCDKGIRNFDSKTARTLEKFLPSTANLRSLSLSATPECLLGIRLHDFRLISHDSDDSDPCDKFITSTSPLTHLDLSEIPLYPSIQRVTTLTDLKIHHCYFELDLVIFLDFLEENRSLEYATIRTQFTGLSRLRGSWRPIQNRLRYLSVSSTGAKDVTALISRIEVQSGAHLEVSCEISIGGKAHVCPLVSTANLLNLDSPTFMGYLPGGPGVCVRAIRLLGPNGSFTMKRLPGMEVPFTEFPLLPLNDVQTFHLEYQNPAGIFSMPGPITFPPLSFPALETLVIKHGTDMSRLFSAFFSDPSAAPSLTTLAFLDCNLHSRKFMEELALFSADRKGTASAWLRRIVIIDSEGKFPSPTLIGSLREHAPVVDLLVDKGLPLDLLW